MKVEYNLYYSPYSKKAYINYNRDPEKHDWVIKYIEGSCDLPDSQIDEDGNILLNGIHDYPVEGMTKITGKFLWKMPFYRQKYVLFDGSGEKILTKLELRNYEKDIVDVHHHVFDDPDFNRTTNYMHQYRFYGIDTDTVFIDDNDPTDEKIVYNIDGKIIKKIRFVFEWHHSEVIEYTNHIMNFRREYIGFDKDLFKKYGEIRSMEIIPFINDLVEGNDNLELIGNSLSYPLDSEKLDFDNSEFLEKMDIFGVLLRNYHTHNFDEFYLKGGKYSGYHIKIINGDSDEESDNAIT